MISDYISNSGGVVVLVSFTLIIVAVWIILYTYIYYFSYRDEKRRTMAYITYRVDNKGFQQNVEKEWLGIINKLHTLIHPGYFTLEIHSLPHFTGYCIGLNTRFSMDQIISELHSITGLSGIEQINDPLLEYSNKEAINYEEVITTDRYAEFTTDIDVSKKIFKTFNQLKEKDTASIILSLRPYKNQQITSRISKLDKFNPKRSSGPDYLSRRRQESLWNKAQGSTFGCKITCISNDIFLTQRLASNFTSSPKSQFRSRPRSMRNLSHNLRNISLLFQIVPFFQRYPIWCANTFEIGSITTPQSSNKEKRVRKNGVIQNRKTLLFEEETITTFKYDS
jgi:hypothetical protein